MSYRGIKYHVQWSDKTGYYECQHDSSLEDIGAHRFMTGRGDEELILKDLFVEEAFKAYPYHINWSDLEGYARSYYTREGHINSLMAYQRLRKAGPPQGHAWDATMHHMHQIFGGFEKIKPIDFKNLRDIPFEPTSAVGYGRAGKKKGDEGELDIAIVNAHATVSRFNRGDIQGAIDDSTPDIAFTRTQLTKLSEKLKIRNVWGQFFAYILIEGGTASPLMDFFAQNETFFHVGRDPKESVPELLKDLRDRGLYMYAFDWKSFDAHVEDWEINIAFNLLKSMIDFNSVPNPELTEAAFEFSRIFFIHRKIASPDGRVYMKHTGIPSGSNFTMLIDSIVNYIRLIYLVVRQTGRLPAALFTQGDDSLLGVYSGEQVNTIQLVDEARALGWPMDDIPKGGEGTDISKIEFLQRSVVGVEHARNVQKCARLALYPEYNVEQGAIATWRAMSIADDCNWRSSLLNWTYAYLNSKYGKAIEEEVPRWIKRKYIILGGV